MKRQKDTTLEDAPTSSEDAQRATGEQWRNSSSKNEVAEPKQKRPSAVDVSDGEKSDAMKPS